MRKRKMFYWDLITKKYRITDTKKLTTISLIISIAVVLHYFESFIPVPAPGAKLGLANIMLILTLFMYGPIEAFFVLIVRSTLGMLLLGNPMSILYSIGGGFMSLVAMILCKKYKKWFSIVGISTIGAAFHNIGQLLVASLVFGTFAIFYTYLPILMIFSILSGTLTGIGAHFTFEKLESIRKSGKQG